MWVLRSEESKDFLYAKTGYRKDNYRAKKFERIDQGTGVTNVATTACRITDSQRLLSEVYTPEDSRGIVAQTGWMLTYASVG